VAAAEYAYINAAIDEIEQQFRLLEINVLAPRPNTTIIEKSFDSIVQQCGQILTSCELMRAKRRELGRWQRYPKWVNYALDVLEDSSRTLMNGIKLVRRMYRAGNWNAVQSLTKDAVRGDVLTLQFIITDGVPPEPIESVEATAVDTLDAGSPWEQLVEESWWPG
jgi:hypothetical protein